MGDSEMKKGFLYSISSLFAVLLYPMTSNAAELVHRVDDAYYRISDTYPPQLYVVAHGHVTSSGWGSPKLVPYLRQKPPVLGVLEFDFVARAAAEDSLVIKKMMPIGANNLLHDYYPAIKAIKINAKTNSMTLQVVPPSNWSVFSGSER